MSNEHDTSRTPTPDHAEHNTFFPSPYSLNQYTSAKTDFDGTDYPTPYKDGKKVLVTGTDERYILTQNGSMFSTGNHPMEMLLPMYHLDRAGFEFDVVMLSSNPVKLEMWTVPGGDKAVKGIYAKYLPKLKAPQKLADFLKQAVVDDSPCATVFVPGGHDVLADIPHGREVKRLLNAFLAKGRCIITLYHSPACLLVPAVDGKPEDYPFKGYEICVFPDALDTGANLEIGYVPGPLPWLMGENLQELGVKILNKGITGQVHRDRKLPTGDNPLASSNLGKLAAKILFEAFVHRLPATPRPCSTNGDISRSSRRHRT